MTAPQTNLLWQVRLFASLSDATLARILRHAVPRTFQAGEIIQWETDPAPGAHFITSGRVQVFRTSTEGREQILANLGAGEALNTVPLFQPDGANPASARALTPVETRFLPREQFLNIVEQSPDLSLALLRDFAGKLSALTGLVGLLSLHSIRGRLARFLIEQADAPAPADPGGTSPRWTQDEIAAHLGTVRDVVGRTLRSFEEAGWVRRRQGRIELLDRTALEAEAEQ